MANSFLEEFFKEMANTDSTPSSETPVKDFIPEALDLARRYQEKEKIQPGDLIIWKPGMKYAKIPDYNEPIVVLETFEPIRSTGRAGTPYECQPQDIRCLVFKDTDGEILSFAYDSRRFTKYVPVSNPQKAPEGV